MFTKMLLNRGYIQRNITKELNNTTIETLKKKATQTQKLDKQ